MFREGPAINEIVLILWGPTDRDRERERERGRLETSFQRGQRPRRKRGDGGFEEIRATSYLDQS